MLMGFFAVYPAIAAYLALKMNIDRTLCGVSVALTELLASVPAAHHQANIVALQAITI